LPLYARRGSAFSRAAKEALPDRNTLPFAQKALKTRQKLQAGPPADKSDPS
jgi:hypothetical protein